MLCPDPFGVGYLRPIGRILRYHAIGGANGTTMVVMFVGWLCSSRQYFPYYSYCRNPTGREFVVPARTLIPIGVKLLTGIPLWVHNMDMEPLKNRAT